MATYTEAAIIYAYYCDLCDYSTNINGSLKAHNPTKAYLAKEAEVRRNTNGNTNASTDASDKTEAAVICKYSYNLPNEYTPMYILLLGYYVWCDLLDQKDFGMAAYLDKKAARSFPPPRPRLMAVILYIAHMLKWTEWMGLMEYPHPFRFCQRAMELDIAAGIRANLELAKDAKLYEMRNEIVSMVPMSVTFRLIKRIS